MSPEIKQRFAERYLAGVPWRDIENEFSYSAAWLSKAAREMGLPRRNHFQTPWTLEGGTHRRWIYQKDELERLVLAGLSNVDIAARLRRSVDGVRHQRRALGYPSDVVVTSELFNILVADLGVQKSLELLGPIWGARPHLLLERRLATQAERDARRNERVAMILKFDGYGALNRDIAAALNISVQTLSKFRNRNNLLKPLKKRKDGRNRRSRKDSRYRILTVDYNA